MRGIKISILALSLLALAGTASAYDLQPICCDGGYEYRHPNAWEIELQRLKDELASARKQAADLRQRNSDLEMQLAAMGGSAADKNKLASELSASRQRVTELEGQLAALRGTLAGESAELARQLAECNKELAALRGTLSAETEKLKEAQRRLIPMLRPQIEKGDIVLDLNNERLLINLSSSYLFGSGEDVLKPAGADALKQVGAVLKDFPEYKVSVEGHTDDVQIQGALKKRFPTNKELSESRAANAAKALAQGGRGNAAVIGYADTRPVEPNTTPEGRAKNRRIEIRVTR